ncbi:MAG TPA: GNAT family N-acetyltransferase [Wenzhouxiangellaceae bacterium]|nr:GNAT family N-acetyltransferase [Wenzhouxiangellaceae bacterium]
MESNQDQVRIRPARAAELPKLAELVRGRLPDLMKPNPATQHDNVRKRLAALLPDEALLLAIDNRKLAGMAALDLDHSRLLAMYLDPKQARADTARRLIASIEDTARTYGIQRLNCTVKPQAWAFMERMGYQATGLPDDNQPVDLSKRLFDEASDWEQQIARLHRELGIAANYGVKHRLQTVRDAVKRVSVGLDIFNRDTELSPEAADAWKAMKGDARRHDIELQLVSGYRSMNYQAELIRKKLASNQSIDRILRVTAAPGYSEHHSADALDLTAPGITPLTQEFSMSRAYEWLKSQARLYGFRESFPNQNRHGIEWEPWHWRYRKTFDPRLAK